MEIQGICLFMFLIFSFRFVVRDFTYDEQMIGKDKEKMTELETERQKLFATLVRWLRVNFSEIFSTWIHVKALRVFVESVLR